MLCCALFVGTSAWAKTEDGEAAAKSEPVSANEEELLNKILSKLPKVSGYIQTGYNYGDKNGDNRSSFQLKRMRVLLDKKISNTFDFRAQFECFSGSTDGGAYKKKVITVMDAFVSAHINKAINFRAGQYYLPLGFENYDISPATLETVDFSNICYRMVCRNAISSADLIDYGRDLGSYIQCTLTWQPHLIFSRYNFLWCQDNPPHPCIYICLLWQKIKIDFLSHTIRIWFSVI